MGSNVSSIISKLWASYSTLPFDEKFEVMVTRHSIESLHKVNPKLGL